MPERMMAVEVRRSTSIHGDEATGDQPSDREKSIIFKMFEKQAREGRVIGRCEKCNRDEYPSVIPGQEIRYCTRCGCKLEYYRETRACSKDAGHVVEPAWDFCGVFGSPVDVKEERVP